MTPVRTLDSGRNPFELFLLIFGLLAGLPLLVGAPPPRSTAELLSPLLVHCWAAFLVGGCAVALAGAWWRGIGRLWRFTAHASTGLLLEQFGLVSVGIGMLIYGIGIISTGAQGTGVPTGFVLAYAAACFWRTTQIQLWVRWAIRDQDD